MNPSPQDFDRIVKQAAEAELPASTSGEELPDLSLDLEEHRLAFQIECLHQELSALRDTHNLRIEYTGRIFWLVVVWLLCVMVAIGLSGFQISSFRLADSVLIAFITSTTVNVVGLFVLVAKWMFPDGRRVPDGQDLHARASELRRTR